MTLAKVNQEYDAALESLANEDLDSAEAHLAQMYVALETYLMDGDSDADK